MKNKLKLLLIMMLAMSIPLVTYANDITITNPTTQDVEVSVSRDSSFTVKIPDHIEFNSDKTATGQVTAGGTLEPGKTLYVYLTSDNNWNLVNTNIYLPYSASGTTMFSSTSWDSSNDTLPLLSVTADDNLGEVIDLTFTRNDATVSGYYQDTLTFTVEVK